MAWSFPNRNMMGELNAETHYIPGLTPRGIECGLKRLIYISAFVVLGIAALFYILIPFIGILVAHGFMKEARQYPAALRQELQSRGSTYVSYDETPSCLKNGIVSVEDERFFQHSALDPLGLMRAIKENLDPQGIVEGGSTITQQLARRILAMKPSDSNSKTNKLKPKLTIIRFAFAFEIAFNKQEILELYINNVYYSRNAQGATAASQAYFGKDLQHISLAECTYLAGLPQSPSNFGADPSGVRARNRHLHVLSSMVRNGYLTQEQADATNQEILKFK